MAEMRRNQEEKSACKNQSISQSKHIYTVPCVMSESEAHNIMHIHVRVIPGLPLGPLNPLKSFF